MKSDLGMQRMKFCYDPVLSIREKTEFDICSEETEAIG